MSEAPPFSAADRRRKSRWENRRNSPENFPDDHSHKVTKPTHIRLSHMSEMLPLARSRSRWRDANRTQVFSSSNSLLQSMHAPTDPPHDIDDWDYKYKLERGSLISTNLYSSNSKKSAISSSPNPQRRRM